MTTHYETLGVSPTATQDEIKKAYRSLSLKLHPDRNSDPDALDKYKLINAAYETLSSTVERQKYDFELNHSADLPGMFTPMFGGGGGIKIFTTHGGLDPMSSCNFGGDPHIDLDHIFHMLSGGNILNPGFNRLHKPVPIITNVQITMDHVLNGASLPLKIERWTMDPRGQKSYETETVYVDIPKGIDENEIIILRDKGNEISEENKGDIKVTVTIKNDTKFSRKGLDLNYNHTITLKESLCGFTFDLPHLNGRVYTINNTKGKVIPDNYTTVLPNLGLSRKEHTGNLNIIFTVQFPTVLTAVQVDGIKAIL
jgi:DnaJ-class molecular chaperone